MAVDLPLCQALVQTNFPGREPVMTRLINLKRESKLTLEQKGNQGRVKTLLWLQERKRGLKKKKKDNPFASGLQLLLFPPPPSCVWVPGNGQHGSRPGSTRCSGTQGKGPAPSTYQNCATRPDHC